MVDEEDDIGEVYIASHRDEIDDYMTRKVNSKLEDEEEESFLDALIGPAPKPKQEMEFVLEQLINLLDSTRDHLCIRAARYILLLDSNTRKDLSDFLSSRSKRLLYERRRRAILTPYMALNYKKEDRIRELPIISIFLLHVSNKVFKDVTQRKRFLMERVVYKDESTYCILIGINNDNEFKKVVTQIISPEQFQDLPKSAFKQLNSTREKISKSRSIKNFE